WSAVQIGSPRLAGAAASCSAAALVAPCRGGPAAAHPGLQRRRDPLGRAHGARRRARAAGRGGGGGARPGAERGEPRAHAAPPVARLRTGPVPLRRRRHAHRLREPRDQRHPPAPAGARRLGHQHGGEPRGRCHLLRDGLGGDGGHAARHPVDRRVAGRAEQLPLRGRRGVRGAARRLGARPRAAARHAPQRERPAARRWRVPARARAHPHGPAALRRCGGREGRSAGTEVLLDRGRRARLRRRGGHRLPRRAAGARLRDPDPARPDELPVHRRAAGSPAGLAVNPEAARERMVAEQLAARGIQDARVLAAMRLLPRERFVPPEVRARAYADAPLPIGEGQTISQPYMVALMSQALELPAAGGRVLEVGTGSGYQAAVLATMGAEVISLERIPTLAARGLGDRVVIEVADGTLGWSARAPYDGILVTAAGPAIPRPLLAQLAPGAALVLPMGEEELQMLVRLRQRPEGLVEEYLGGCRFVRLVGRHGWNEA